MKNINKNGSKKWRTRKMKTPEQLRILEEAYALGMYLPVPEQRNLGESIGLTQKQVQMWFIFRRLKDKKKCSQRARHKMDDSVGESGSGSGSGSGSDSSRANEPLEAADKPDQIVSRKPLPQTINPTEIELRIEKEVTTRLEMEVRTRLVSNVDSLRVEMDEKVEVINANLRKDVFESCRKELIDRCVGGSGSSFGGGVGDGGGDDDGGVGDGSDVVGGVSDVGDGSITTKMINMLTEKNKREKAKYQSLLNEIACLGKSITDTDKLINDIKEVC